MRFIARLVFGIALMSVVTACQNNQSGATATPDVPIGGAPGVSGVIGWDKNPASIVFRADAEVNNEPLAPALNRLPLCTLYGDGHLVWINQIQGGGEEVLEAYIDDQRIRRFLEFVIRDMRFFDMPNYADSQLPPDGLALVETLSLNTGGQVRTLRNYSIWPEDRYVNILNACKGMTSAPASYLPRGGWVTVREAGTDRSAVQIRWPVTASFRMADVAAADRALWVSDASVRVLWNSIRQSNRTAQFVEGEKVYDVIVQVPLISRDSPPAPAPTPTPTEEIPPTLSPEQAATP